ncbi:hypothetical protein BO70DRAFT_428870 [Aspergillus heteromorphus CBS 117.55]|uniref:Thioesterase domain-containing protein n=1 Tax=Aspergillus heteromorphus CBS 117.55 TaxID=1448321 RepID=A0A317WAQ2_9EURO|nr:uncharacterized protein BO70DRAFT_428870 [Aspergillus heteromorphus CBS 117.55]PWY83606.1 hypothetical protein BO70DRAFT_428870 [Aspergillus heteromorphus CBS 117.55]
MRVAYPLLPRHPSSPLQPPFSSSFSPLGPNPQSQPQALTPTHLFLPIISTSRSPLSECDYNLHKSNSTYLSDVDVSRANLCALLFGSRLALRPTTAITTITSSSSLPFIIVILGGVQCVFRKEISPYQAYDIWTRVFSWDEKWMYVVSHFVVPGVFRGRGRGRGRGEEDGDGSEGKEGAKKSVFATCVSRVVFKQGRVTVPPGRMLGECGLLGVDGMGAGNDVEERRCRDLEKAQLKCGWDAVHEAFDPDIRVVLERFMG